MTRTHRRLTAVAAGALAIAMVGGCAGTGVRPGSTVVGVTSLYAEGATLAAKPYQREAQGGGYVTVDVTIFAGPLPDSNMAAGPPTLIARFSNKGGDGVDGNKKEKRYGWKPKHEAVYDLVLEPGTAGRTKWIMYERRGPDAPTVYRTGSLAPCERYPHESRVRDVAFKDCPVPVRYDPTETVAVMPRDVVVRFASDLDGGEMKQPWAIAPAWISCNSGCCSLGW